MKHTKILSIFSLIVILSLLALAVPVMAADRDIVLVPEEGAIGTEITVAGEAISFNQTLSPTDISCFFTVSLSSSWLSCQAGVDIFSCQVASACLACSMFC